MRLYTSRTGDSPIQLFNFSSFSCSEETHLHASLHIADSTFTFLSYLFSLPNLRHLSEIPLTSSVSSVMAKPIKTK